MWKSSSGTLRARARFLGLSGCFSAASQQREKEDEKERLKDRLELPEAGPKP